MRPATPADTDAILVLMGAFYREEGLALHPAADAALATLLADPRLGFVILAEHGSKVAGYVVLTYGFSLELGGRDAFVDELFVAPARRRVGLGEGLLRAALVRGAQRGPRRCFSKWRRQMRESWRSTRGWALPRGHIR